MSRVLIVNPSYLPGYKSGGPQQTIQNVCDVFGKNNDIYLVTINHDYGNTDSYDIETNKWHKLYGINIMYVEPRRYGIKLFKSLYRDFDTILACGLFASSTVKMMMVNDGKTKRLFVAPMGVFSKNALAIKKVKKLIFIKLFSMIGAFKRVIWSFTSEEEYQEARIAIGKKNIQNYIIAEDLPRHVDFNTSRETLSRSDDVLRIVFISRIVAKKNLLHAIRILSSSFEGNVKFDIYGIIEDGNYWRECKAAIQELPDNVKCSYCGSIRPDESITVFSEHDIFLFPTQGENYGHVIYEALAAGCIPIISDTTPWKDFDEKNCGNVINLNDIDQFRRMIQMYLDMKPEEIYTMKLNAIDYAEEKYENAIQTTGYKAIFEDPYNGIEMAYATV